MSPSKALLLQDSVPLYSILLKALLPPNSYCYKWCIQQGLAHKQHPNQYCQSLATSSPALIVWREEKMLLLQASGRRSVSSCGVRTSHFNGGKGAKKTQFWSKSLQPSAARSRLSRISGPAGEPPHGLSLDLVQLQKHHQTQGRASPHGHVGPWGSRGAGSRALELG